MRLLETATFKLKSFFDHQLRPYAILSHTWGEDEITFEEVQLENTTYALNSTKQRIVNGESIFWLTDIKKGILKIAGCAAQAEKDGFDYIWCDICCIDKTNSSELSEAINSMYRWYEGELCYAYLADVPSASQQTAEDRNTAFAQSSWCTRGWNLQELIAPSQVVFFDETW